ncbi:DegT/DnrJ/EryC1/StrS family aminotransferase [Aeromicrobium wangtongii]|uniref:DegT/DnrJ/EryC1/StrS family aminotransferase n=1 Tax=Aeromicrobium wangtongii TaxID=2969247 RepID=A0ABY5M910_9ACTN|nr:DegT/DnrJ/EryC1/StrS family aminotransferase [Aeromicrobium wangtongii]MCD9199584.1 DegT/DnrJ/EryC1/StrS family aminotransferase [Aeromicrobium wangtongii]UUP13937.1 DegT/DnrJ/EryC1/StrS family aminotransferase [Aeromicrobium wangtongii]
MIPITVVEFGTAEEELVLQVLRSGNVAQGPMVARFEEEFASLVGTKHAVAVNNGTTALVAALQVLDLEPGDEVLTTPFTFVATLNAILEAGATATFADIDESDFNVTAKTLSEGLTERTRALLPVHLYGQAADTAPIAALAEEHGLGLIEDAAQSHGATVDGRGAGSFGIGTFSFYATKNLTTGEGGMITTDDDDIADRLRVLRNQGMRARYQYEVAGHNYRLTDLQAALVLPQLERYPSVIASRQANAAHLTAGLMGIEGITPPVAAPGRQHVWHQYTIRVDSTAGIDREAFVERLHAGGVGAGIYYPKLVFDYDCYRGREDVRVGSYPVAERIVREVVSLPVHPHLTTDQLDHIIATVADAAARS